MVRVAALVVNWGTPDDLKRCVMSSELYENDLHWGIYDNKHPHVDSRAALDGLGFGLGPSRVIVNAARKNFGHGHGINRLARMATAVWDPEYFFVVNPDCMWTEPILDRMMAFLDEDQNRAVVGPKQLDSQYQITAGGIFGTNEKPEHRMWRVKDRTNNLVRDLVPATVVAGSAMLIRARDFFLGDLNDCMGIPGMLEAYHYYSETWLCYHLRAHGRTLWYWGEPWMVHEWHRSSPVGFAGTDGKFAADREKFRAQCDIHRPPILRD